MERIIGLGMKIGQFNPSLMEKADPVIGFKESRLKLIDIAFSDTKHMNSLISLTRPYSKKPLELIPGVLHGYHALTQFVATLDFLAKQTGYRSVDSLYRLRALNQYTLNLCYANRIYPVADEPVMSQLVREQIRNLINTRGVNPNNIGLPHFASQLFDLKGRMIDAIPWRTLEFECTRSVFHLRRVEGEIHVQYRNWIQYLFEFMESLRFESEHEFMTAQQFPVAVLESICTRYPKIGSIIQKESQGLINIEFNEKEEEKQ